MRQKAEIKDGLKEININFDRILSKSESKVVVYVRERENNISEGKS